jgi:hypothetical protein
MSEFGSRLDRPSKWPRIVTNTILQNYLWGFSFVQLFICMLLLLAWTLGIYALWLHTHYTMTLRKRLYEDISGNYRAILELAAAMQRELHVEHVNPSVLREKQLKERVNKEILGGRISYINPTSEPEIYSMLKAFRAWSKTERWWLLAMMIISIFCSIGWLSIFFPLGTSEIWLWFWSLSVWLGQLSAFCIGSTAGSRLLIISFWAIIGAITIGSLAGFSATDS